MGYRSPKISWLRLVLKLNVFATSTLRSNAKFLNAEKCCMDEAKRDLVRALAHKSSARSRLFPQTLNCGIPLARVVPQFEFLPWKRTILPRNPPALPRFPLLEMGNEGDFPGGRASVKSVRCCLYWSKIFKLRHEPIARSGLAPPVRRIYNARARIAVLAVLI